jgi:hypothetical protein
VARSPIPPHVEAELAYLSDRTCCVCRTPYLQLQIHHLDGDPSNNDSANLALLCLQHHGEAEIKGGLGRKLSPAAIRKFRTEWYAAVAERRDTGEPISPGPQSVDRQRDLRRLVRIGTELQSEAYFAGVRADSQLSPLAWELRLAELETFRARERAWTFAVEDALNGSPAAEAFMEVHGIPATDYYAIHNRVEARVKFLRSVLEASPAAGGTPMQRLSGAVEAGMRLRARVVVEPDSPPPLSEDRLYQWARRSYQVLLREGVLEADEFYGEDPSLGPAYFGLAFSFATSDLGRARYLETRLDLLKRALARHS